MKSVVFPMNGKNILIKSCSRVTKYWETMYIENYVKPLTIIQNNFSRISQLQKNNGSLSKTKLTQITGRKIAKLKDFHNVISNEKSIANCLNNCFARIRLYNDEVIAPKMRSSIFKGNEFNLRPVTRRELYKVYDQHKNQLDQGNFILCVERL